MTTDEYLVVEVPRPQAGDVERVIAGMRADGFVHRDTREVRVSRSTHPRIAFLVFIRRTAVQ